MSRLGIVAVHLLALPGALLVAALISLGGLVLFPASASQRAIDIQLHDTYFVVAHVHVSGLVSAWVAVTTLVAFRQGKPSGLFGAAWVCLVLHLAAAALRWRVLGGAEAREVTVLHVAPLHLGFASLYVTFALLAVLASMAGLVVSLVRGLQSRQPDPA